VQVVSAAVVVGVESVFLGPAVLEFWAGVGVEDEMWVGGGGQERRRRSRGCMPQLTNNGRV